MKIGRNPRKTWLSDTKSFEKHCRRHQRREAGGWGGSSAVGDVGGGGASLEDGPHALTRRCMGNRVDCAVNACDSHAPFLATKLGGRGRRRLAHLPRGPVLSHALPNFVFQKTHLPPPPLGFFRFSFKKLCLFWEIQALGFDIM